ncbi:MAG: hypothetical protein JW993_02740 [Sedimentisphaerales bacterium]|nr:hypothetical protein [Sedimentisphaerales bacterium]
MALYREKYRVETTRLASWDYSSRGYYFVTICTKAHENSFGEIVAGEMVRTNIGQAACECWQAIPRHFPFARPEDFVLMPNHVHGIVAIEQDGQAGGGNAFGPQSGNLAAIIRGYKIGVKKCATAQGVGFHWQPRFYEHIIRDQRSLEKIRHYIATNPQRWEFDEYNQARQRHRPR